MATANPDSTFITCYNGNPATRLKKALETSSSYPTSSEDLPTMETKKLSEYLGEQPLSNDYIIMELECLRVKNQVIESKLKENKEILIQISKQTGEILQQNVSLEQELEKVSSERNAIHDVLCYLKESSRAHEDWLVKEKDEIQLELDVCKHRIEELSKDKSEIVRMCSENLESVKLIVGGFQRTIENLEEYGTGNLDIVKEKVEESEFDGDFKDFSWELNRFYGFLEKVQLELEEYKARSLKEKKELEDNLVSLAEENRDITSLLKIALVEKEDLEKSLNRMRGNNEQKRMAILQIAERGLQKVGFGFILGAGASEQSSETTGASGDAKSDSSDCDEEVASLALSVERIMKNLRIEITQLRRSLEESRSENERQQTLIEKQARKLAEQSSYGKELEDREVMLSQKIKELQIELKETMEDVVRWREACELEAEAGRNILDEREKVVKILQQELEKSRAALNRSSEKLKIKEELVAAAIAAQEAAAKSLQLADSRAAGLCAQIEELTRHLEEAEKRDRANRHVVRRICWPWRALRFNLTNAKSNGVRLMLPEMQALVA